MAESPAGSRPEEARVPTGTPQLDEILAGGLVAHRPYLIVGPSGTGKTTLALQFLCEGVRRGEPCLIVTLEEPPNEMRLNHRGLQPDLDQVYVFDAIPDVMRYERTPFKDIAAVRSSIPFAQVPVTIRKTPELSSVEVTFTALEQTLKTEITRRRYSRLVIDSLTALQYFCMKGVDESVGAQTFLRFLSDLRVTTLLTVEAPLEDLESPERLLARGEIRLFRWELEGKTVRALGVEKFRGSGHDIRLHPYRISGRGLDVNLAATVSRDTRRVVEELPPSPAPVPAPPAPVDPLAGFEQYLADLIVAGADVGPVSALLSEADAAAKAGRPDDAGRTLMDARVAATALAESVVPPDPTTDAADTERNAAVARLATRLADVRGGVPPKALVAPSAMVVHLQPSIEVVRMGLRARHRIPPSTPGAVAATVVPRPPASGVVPVPMRTTTPVSSGTVTIDPGVARTALDGGPAPSVRTPSPPKANVLAPRGASPAGPSEGPPPLPTPPPMGPPPPSVEASVVPTPDLGTRPAGPRKAPAGEAIARPTLPAPSLPGPRAVALPPEGMAPAASERAVPKRRRKPAGGDVKRPSPRGRAPTGASGAPPAVLVTEPGAAPGPELLASNEPTPAEPAKPKRRAPRKKRPVGSPPVGDGGDPIGPAGTGGSPGATVAPGEPASTSSDPSATPPASGP